MFWRLWAAACRAQKWTADHGVSREELEERRHDLLATLGFGSLHDVDRTAGFDAIKAALLTLQNNLDGAVEADHPEVGAARRFRHVLRTKIIPGLGLYVTEPEAYAAAIARDRFGQSFRLDLDAMSPAQAEQCLFTLSARLEAHRRQAGDTPAQMRAKLEESSQTSSMAAL